MVNEKRLIDDFRNEIMRKFIEQCQGNDFNRLTLLEIGETIDSVYEKHSTLPTVDAVEVVQGWWIELPSMEPDYKCSECGRSYAWWEPSEAHYCPNCGAKMDGGTSR